MGVDASARGAGFVSRRRGLRRRLAAWLDPSLAALVPPDAGPVGTFIPSPVEVEVGGAIAFVMPVERFEKF